jgi:hypothetical protein
MVHRVSRDRDPAHLDIIGCALGHRIKDGALGSLVHDMNDVRPTVGDRRDPLDCHGKLFDVRGIGRYQDVDLALQ